MSAPNREVRKKCYYARDMYWKCLDKYKEDEKKCSDVQATFENSCPKQWIKHFTDRRNFEKLQELAKSGALDGIQGERS